MWNPETWRCKVGADVIDCSVDEFDCEVGDTVICSLEHSTQTGTKKSCDLKITKGFNGGTTIVGGGESIDLNGDVVPVSSCQGGVSIMPSGSSLRCTSSGLTCDTGGGGSPTMPPQTCDCSSYGRDWYSVSNTSGGAPYCSSSSAYEDRACPELELSSKPLTACGYSIYDGTLGIKKTVFWELYCNDELNNKTLMTEAEYKNLINQYFIGGFDQSGFINNYLKDSGANVSTNNEVYTYGDGTVQEVDYFYFRGGKNNMIINLDIMTETSDWGDYQYFNLAVYDDLYNTSGGNSRTSFVNYFLVRNTNTGNFEYFEIYKEIDEIFK